MPTPNSPTNRQGEGACVKDEGANLATLAAVLNFVVTCKPLGMIMPYDNTCFGHAISKACQYVTMDEKVCGGMLEVRISKAQATLQKTTTWTNKSGIGRVLMLVALQGN